MKEQITEVEHLFLALADKTRLQLLYLLRDGEISVTALSEALNTSQPKVSRHLAYLRTMNVVSTRREGKSIYYKLDIPANTFGAAVVDETIHWLNALTGSYPDSKRPRAEPRPASQATFEQPSFETRPKEPNVLTELEPEYVEPETEPEMEVYLL